MDPLIGSALIGAGGNIASTLLGGGGISKSATREQVTDSFQALVRTARAEGIHPLFALGSNVPIPPQMAGGESKAGAAIRAATQSIADYPLMKAQIEESESRKQLNDAERIAIQSRQAAEQQAEAINNDGAVVHAYGTKPGAPLQMSPVEINPRFAPVRDPYTGRVTRQTGEKVQKDITEVFGPYIDDWIHNPGERARIEKELGEAFRAAPGVRHIREWSDNQKREFIEGAIRLRRSLKGFPAQDFKRRLRRLLLGGKRGG